MSGELVNNPVIDYVPDASNEKGVRDEILRESDGSDGSQEHGIAGAVDLNDLNEYDHSDGDYVEDGQNVPFDEPPMHGVAFKEDRDACLVETSGIVKCMCGAAAPTKLTHLPKETQARYKSFVT